MLPNQLFPIRQASKQSEFVKCAWQKTLMYVLVLCVGVIGLAKLGTGLPEWREVIAAENGPVERISAALWFMGFTWCLAAACSQRMRRVEWLSLAMVLLLCGLRELDAHVWSTGWNLDKLANYWNPRYPLSERILVVGGIVVPSLIVGGIIGLRLWHTMGRAWIEGKTWISHLVVGMILLLLSLTLDKVGPYGLSTIGVGEAGQIILMEIEEFLEFVLAAYTVAVLWPYLQEAFNGYDSDECA